MILYLYYRIIGDIDNLNLEVCTFNKIKKKLFCVYEYGFTI